MEASGDLARMEALVLLDLIGGPSPQFISAFAATHHLFRRLVTIERRLAREGVLGVGGKPYFQDGPARPLGIEDDHIPFLRRNVPVLHLIAVPFPPVWHTVDDDGDHIDHASVNNLLAIFREFLHVSLK